MSKLGYIRTSTDKQLIDRQVNQLEKICDEVFIEDGVSAVKKKRPVYDRLINQLVDGDVLVVLSLDRAYRSVIDALSELDKLHQRNIEFYSLTQNFDTRTPEGKLLYTVSAALAEWERSILSKRTKEGMEAARKRGSIIGRPRKLRPEQVSWAISMMESNGGICELNLISTTLNVSPQTLKRALETHKIIYLPKKRKN